MGDEPRPEVPCRVVSDIDTAHTDAPGWNITTWADRDGHEWERSAAPGMLRRYADGAVITRTEEEVRADHGPLTPAAVDNVAALVADESRYRQQWHAAARDRLAQSQGNAPTEVDTLLQVAQERVQQLEALADEAITIICRVGSLGLDLSRRNELHAEGIRLRKALDATSTGTEEQR